MGELLSGAEGLFRGQGMGTPGTVPAGGVRGPVPGAPLSVEDALDGDLDAYLDRELFVGPSESLPSRASEPGPASAASGSMRALLDLADEESQWLETLPPPAVSVTPPPEPEEPAVEIPAWMRTSPGAKVTMPFAAMLTPVDAAAVPAEVATDTAGQPVTPWSVPTSAQQAHTPASYPGGLLPGLAPTAPMPPWAPRHAVPMAQPWGVPPPAHAEPKRIAGMKPGALIGAAAAGALAAGLLVVAGLHFREHAAEAQAGARNSFVSPSPVMGTQVTGAVLPTEAPAGVQSGLPGTALTSQNSSTPEASSAQQAATSVVELHPPSARKQPTKPVAARPVEDTEAEAAPGELTFHDSETGADEEAVPTDDTEAGEQESELDEEFARELGFTEDAEAKASEPKAPERTVYVPPAPDAKESLTPDDVKAVVVANQPAITACLREHAQGTSLEKGGRFTVRWSVLPNGDAIQVALDTDALKATPLAHCIEDVVRRWKFPVHQVRMEAPIHFPFVF